MHCIWLESASKMVTVSSGGTRSSSCSSGTTSKSTPKPSLAPTANACTREWAATVASLLSRSRYMTSLWKENGLITSRRSISQPPWSAIARSKASSVLVKSRSSSSTRWELQPEFRELDSEGWIQHDVSVGASELIWLPRTLSL